jgi:hypothetical protein
MAEQAEIGEIETHALPSRFSKEAYQKRGLQARYPGTMFRYMRSIEPFQDMQPGRPQAAKVADPGVATSAVIGYEQVAVRDRAAGV